MTNIPPGLILPLSVCLPVEPQHGQAHHPRGPHLHRRLHRGDRAGADRGQWRRGDRPHRSPPPRGFRQEGRPAPSPRGEQKETAETAEQLERAIQYMK